MGGFPDGRGCAKDNKGGGLASKAKCPIRRKRGESDVAPIGEKIAAIYPMHPERP